MIAQLRQVERILRSGARGSIYDMASRINEAFLAHPELRPYFFDGKKISPESKDYARAVAVADYYCLYLEQITTQGENVSASSRKSWYKYAADIYSNSPLLKAYLKGKRSWYAPVFWEVVEGRKTG